MSVNLIENTTKRPLLGHHTLNGRSHPSPGSGTPTDSRRRYNYHGPTWRMRPNYPWRLSVGYLATVRPSRPGNRWRIMSLLTTPCLDRAPLGWPRPYHDPRRFRFDHVLGPDASQSEVFDAMGAEVVDAVLEGFSGTLLAYGMTGSGKTHTVFGPQRCWERDRYAPCSSIASLAASRSPRSLVARAVLLLAKTTSGASSPDA